ncbi:MAG: creatininase family protein [Solirubrobacterales bacterium]
MTVYALESMTTPEVQDQIESGRDLIVVPFGAIEQHGPHLPIGTDAILGDEIGYRTADRLDAFLAPTVRVGCSPHHMAFAGTVTVQAETLTRIAIEISESLAQHGFKRIFLLPTHFGNFASLAAAAAELEKRDLNGTAVVSPSDYFAQVLEGATLGISAELGIAPGESGAHCGEWETSVMLVLRPDLVHMDRAEPGYTGDLQQGLAKVFSEGTDAIASNGVIGDPTRASADHGERYIARLVEIGVEAVQQAQLA